MDRPFPRKSERDGDDVLPDAWTRTETLAPQRWWTERRGWQQRSPEQPPDCRRRCCWGMHRWPGLSPGWLQMSPTPAQKLFLKNVKSFPSLKAHWAALISVSLALSQTPVFTLWDHGYGASASCGVPDYFPAFDGTHCAYPQGMARLSWPGWLITYPDGHPSKY